ncbi:MAG: hypothetical protein ABIZ80_00965, partial [Bryobacteraceae bacterium]
MLTSTAIAQTLDNKSLTGKYYFRELFLTTDAVGNVTEVRSLLGSATYDGNGGYTFTGQQNIGAGAATQAAGTGTYTVGAAGFVTMSDPARTTLALNARLGTSALIGSTTETSENVFNLFIAVPAPTSTTTNASVTGAYWAADLELAGGTAAQVRTSFLLLTANGSGALADTDVSGHTPGQQGGAVFTQNVKGSTYRMNADGSGAATFGASTLLAPAKTIYVSRDGNLIIGGSTAAGAHDLIVAVKRVPGNVTAASWKDKFWTAGLRIEARDVSGYAGSTASDSASKLLLTRRVHAVGVAGGGIDFTGVNPYSLAADGSGSALDIRVARGSEG